MSTSSAHTGGGRKGNGSGSHGDLLARARPNFHQHAHEIQAYGTVVRYPIALDEKIRIGASGGFAAHARRMSRPR